MTLDEVAESYLNELLVRCLVQVAATYGHGRIDEIRVHDMIRHIILVKASEQNIATIFHRQEGMCFQNNVRRLSVQGSINGNSKQPQGYCKSIRTLYLCEEVGGHISELFLSDLLSKCGKLLKVLDLKGAQLNKFPPEIFKLFHLTYLSLENTNVRSVPKSIGVLQSLEYLNLKGTHVTVLPVEIEELQNLRHLQVGRHPIGARSSFRIGSLKSLQQLYFIKADQVDEISVVTEVVKLVHLRELGITKLKREDGKDLCSSLANLRELRELFVYSVNEEEFIDFQYLRSPDLPRLHTLILAGRLEKCPEFICSLNGLTEIDLRHSKISDDPLKCLHHLPNLITLVLNAAYEGESLCFKSGGFPKLNILFLILLEELRWVTVEENALRSLQLLYMRSCESMEEIPTGIEYLMSLQNLEFSNMSNEFVNKLENLDAQSAAYKWLLRIPRVVIATWADGEWLKARYFNKQTGTFNN